MRPADPPPPLPLDAHTGLTAVQSLLELLVVALFVAAFIVQPFRIPSESMDPTLKIGDFLLVDKQAFSAQAFSAHSPLDAVLPPTAVHRGDVVVFHFPLDPNVHVVKRVVALPGDRLRLRDGRLILNGQPVAEPYAVYSPGPPDIFRDDFPALHNMSSSVDPAWWRAMRQLTTGGELTVPPGQYFVMGDNRNNSTDSRYWGFVPAANLVGRPLVVYFSLAHADATPASSTLPQRLSRFWHNIRRVR